MMMLSIVYDPTGKTVIVYNWHITACQINEIVILVLLQKSNLQNKEFKRKYEP